MKNMISNSEEKTNFEIALKEIKAVTYKFNEKVAKITEGQTSRALKHTSALF